MKVLGIGFLSESSVALIEKFKLKYAISQERLNRIKNWWGNPFETINFVLKETNNTLKEIDHVYINGDLDNKVPNILNISFNFVEGESLIMGLKDIAVSSGSACTSASLEPSYVLRALGRKDELAHSSIRFSFGRFTSDDDVNNTLDTVSYTHLTLPTKA